MDKSLLIEDLSWLYQRFLGICLHPNIVNMYNSDYLDFCSSIFSSKLMKRGERSKTSTSANTINVEIQGYISVLISDIFI